MSKKLWTRDNLAKWMFKVYDSVDEEEAKKYLGLDPDEDITEAIPEEYLDDCAYFLIAKDWAYKELADYGYDFVWFMAGPDGHYLGQTMGDRMYDVTDEVLNCVYRAVESGKYEDEYKKHLGESKKSFGKMNEAYEAGDTIEYKGVMIEYFPYAIEYGDSEQNVEGWVIKSPYYLQSNPNKDKYYLPLYCEDEDGEEVNFETLDDAKDYIDKYIITKRGKIRIKHGDEIHYEIL